MKKEQSKLPWGDRMIKLSIALWTNGVPEKAGLKAAEFKGAIHIVKNKSRGIHHDWVFFNDKAEFFSKLQELLDRQNVKLVKLSGFTEFKATD